mgnify:CR=1 FL=1
MGAGAFNLVRRSLFEQTEGWEWLRLEIADDVGLAFMMHRHQAKSFVVFGKTLCHRNRNGDRCVKQAQNDDLKNQEDEKKLVQLVPFFIQGHVAFVWFHQLIALSSGRRFLF